MNIRIKKLFIVALFVFCGGISQAEDLYVCHSSGEYGTEDGSSWANCFDGFGDISWGAGAGSVSAGDTLYVDGGSSGVTYTATGNNMLAVGASGSVGSPITIATGAKSPSPSSHSGTVIFDGDSASYHSLISLDNRTYITIDGESSGSRNWTLQNTVTSDSEAAAIQAASADNLILTYVTISDIGMGLYATYTDALEVSYCSITGVTTDAAIRNIVSNAAASDYGQAKYHHNTIQTNTNESTGAGPDGIQSGISSDIYNNEFSTAVGTVVGAQHPDMIQSAGWYHRIYNNTFRNMIDSAVDVDCGTNWDDTFSHLQIYNNVFTVDSDCSDGATWPSGVRVYNGSYSSVVDIIIANNSFVDIRGDGVFGGRPLHITPPAGITIGAGVEIKNNIFYNTGSGSWATIEIAASDASQSDWNVDYNLVNAGEHGDISVIVDGSAYTQSNPRTSEPVFTTYTHTSPTNSYNLDSSDTAAKDQGVDLSEYFTTDKDGTTRSGTWDIGAYEYGEETPANAIQGVNIN